MLKYYRKSAFADKVWPANLALFIYVSTHYIETVKYLTTTDAFSCLDGIEVTRRTVVHEIFFIYILYSIFYSDIKWLPPPLAH